MRLDRFLAKTLGETRTTVKKYIRTKKVTVNGEVIISDGFQVDTINDVVAFDGEVLQYEEFQYYLINKPEGYVCANEDNVNPTIISFAPEFMMYKFCLLYTSIHSVVFWFTNANTNPFNICGS